MSEIKPNTNYEGAIRQVEDCMKSVFKKGVKYGRYLERQAQREPQKENARKGLKDEVVKAPTELISKDEVVKALEDYAQSVYGTGEAYSVFRCLRIVRNIPAYGKE